MRVARGLCPVAAVAVAAVVALAAAAGLAGLAWAGHGRPPGGTPAGGERPGDLTRLADTGADAYEAAMTAYVWGAPLVTMDRTRRRLTCLGAPNRLLHVPRLSTPADRAVVMPNVDTLYTTAWLDLRRGPVTFEVPAVPADRYYVFQFMDMYTNTFANLGSRTTGQGPATYLVAGPGWRGRVPAGVRLLRSPTPDVWMLGRTLVKGPDDVGNANRVQLGYRLTPPVPPVAPSPAGCGALKDPQDLASGGAGFLDELGRVMAANPPPARDRAIVRQLARAGIGAGRTPSTRVTDPAAADGLARGVAAGNDLVARTAGTAQAPVGGWTTNRDIGTYAQRFVTRAVVARVGLGANVPEESVYYRAQQDAAGVRLDGNASYRVHFPAGQLPGTGALGFWSLTMYDRTHFLVPNAISRHAIGDRTPGLRYNADGSLDVWVGPVAPAGRESNWLPSPKAPFFLSLRVYVPSDDVRSQRWKPPVIEKLQPLG